MPADRYPVPAGPHRVEADIQRSRFITSIAPAPTVDDATQFVRAVSNEFADATHNCWAYVVGPPGSTAQVGMSDDGEPHGTAGRPMLGVLLHADVGDVVVVVTRYYGGQKLGTGGLVRAYGGGVQLALASVPRAEHVRLASARVVIDYPHVDAVQQLLSALEVRVVGQDYLERVRYELELPVANLDALRHALLDITRGQTELVVDDR